MGMCKQCGQLEHSPLLPLRQGRGLSGSSNFHYLMPGHRKYTNVCRCVRHSIGILPDGDVVACFWALNSATGTVDPKFLLGNVRDNSLLEILDGEKAHYWSDREHCCELRSSSDPEGSDYHDVLSA